MIPVIEAATLDGVTVLHSGSASTRTRAALVFRVGRFDETLPTAGITHLVEHLTLTGHKPEYQFNAQVSGLFTMFVMESDDPADVTGFVSAVCQGLAADHIAALDHEKRVLRTESASRGGAGALGACLVERYGASGPAVAAYEEYGLRRLHWPEIADWRRRWFTAGNAVLWIEGDIPDGLRIDLPPGAHLLPAAVRPVIAELPGYLPGGKGGIGLSMMAPYSLAAFAAMDILQERLTQVLRHERGLSYGIQGSIEEVDTSTLHAWLSADALPEHGASVAHAALTTIEQLTATGSTSEEIAGYTRRLRDRYESPAGTAGLLHRRAQHLLCGRPLQQPEKMLQEISQLDGLTLGHATGELSSQMIVSAPQLFPAIRGRMPRLPMCSAGTVSGTEFKSQSGTAVLTLGDEGVMVSGEESQRVTLRFSETAALLRWSSDKRTLIGADGFSLYFDPADWLDGVQVLHAIETRVLPGRTIQLDSAGPATPGWYRHQDKATPAGATAAAQPSTAGEPIQPPAAAPPQAAPQRGGSLRLWRIRIIRAIWIAWTIFGLLAVSGGDRAAGAVFALIGVAGIAGQVLLAGRRARKMRQPRGT